MNSNYGSNSDKYLVVEQRGLRVVLTGLFISFFLGLTFRAIFSPQRIKYEIEKAIESSNIKQFEASIEKAHLSLHENGFPRLAIIIENFSLQSFDPCFDGLQIKIDNLTIPVSISSVINRSLQINKIEVAHLKAHFKQLPTSQCNANSDSQDTSFNKNSESKSEDLEIQALDRKKTNTSSGDSSSTNSSAKQSASTSAELTNATATNAPLVQTLSVEGSQLEEIELLEGQFFFEDYPSFYYELKKVAIEIDPTQKNKIHFEGGLHLQPLSENKIQGLHTQLSLEVNSDDVKSQLVGNWREGHLNFLLDYNLKTKNLNLQGEMDQVPLGQLFVFGQSLGWWKEAPSARQSWVSLKSNFSIDAKNNSQKIKIEDFKIEGDFGEVLTSPISGERVNVKNEKWSWNAIRVSIKSVILSKLLTVFDYSHPSPTLASLGVLDGQLEMLGSQIKSFYGDISGLEFIFSNKGIRELQVVEKFSVDLKELDQILKFDLHDVKLKNSEFDGKVSGLWNPIKKQAELDVNIQSLTLNPQVIKLMTSNGFISPLQGKLKIKFDQNQDSAVTYDGQFKVERGEVEKIFFDKLKWDVTSIYSNEKGLDSSAADLNVQSQLEHLFKLSIHDLKWTEDANSLEIVEVIIGEKPSQFNLKNLNVQAKKNKDRVEWFDFQTNISNDPKNKILSQGFWTKSGELSGIIQVKHDKKIKEIKISGTREKPLFE